MGEILNEYFPSVFTVEERMHVRELGEINSDVLRSVHIAERKRCWKSESTSRWINPRDLMKCIPGHVGGSGGNCRSPSRDM